MLWWAFGQRDESDRGWWGGGARGGTAADWVEEAEGKAPGCPGWQLSFGKLPKVQVDDCFLAEDWRGMAIVARRYWEKSMQLSDRKRVELNPSDHTYWGLCSRSAPLSCEFGGLLGYLVASCDVIRAAISAEVVVVMLYMLDAATLRCTNEHPGTDHAGPPTVTGRAEAGLIAELQKQQAIPRQGRGRGPGSVHACRAASPAYSVAWIHRPGSGEENINGACEGACRVLPADITI